MQDVAPLTICGTAQPAPATRPESPPRTRSIRNGGASHGRVVRTVKKRSTVRNPCAREVCSTRATSRGPARPPAGVSAPVDGSRVGVVLRAAAAAAVGSRRVVAGSHRDDRLAAVDGPRAALQGALGLDEDLERPPRRPMFAVSSCLRGARPGVAHGCGVQAAARRVVTAPRPHTLLHARRGGWVARWVRTGTGRHSRNVCRVGTTSRVVLQRSILQHRRRRACYEVQRSAWPCSEDATDGGDDHNLAAANSPTPINLAYAATRLFHAISTPTHHIVTYTTTTTGALYSTGEARHRPGIPPFMRVRGLRKGTRRAKTDASLCGRSLGACVGP